MLEKTLESPWDCKEIKPINPKGNQPWILFGRTGAEVDVKSWLIGRPWCWEKLKAEGKKGDGGWDGWMASLINGHELEQTPGDGDGQGSLACYSPWGHKESDTTWWLNNNNNYKTMFFFFSFIFISWRIITLQYCSDFCHTLTWISDGFTCVPHPDPPLPPPSPSHPSGSSQCTSPEHLSQW